MMHFTLYLAQNVTDPAAGQIERIINRMLDSGDAAYVLALLAILAGVLYAVYKVLVPFIKVAQEAVVTFTNASKDQTAVTKEVAVELKTNNEATLATKQTVGEIKAMVETSNTNAAATATKVTDIDTKIAQISTDVGNALTEIAALKTAIATSAQTDVQLMSKVDALAVQMATALIDLREIKGDLHSKPQTTVNVAATVPTDSSVSKDSFDTKQE